MIPPPSDSRTTARQLHHMRVVQLTDRGAGDRERFASPVRTRRVGHAGASWRPRLGVVVSCLVALSTLAALAVPVVRTAAVWQDREQAGLTFSAGVVAPPTNLKCNQALIDTQLKFTWNTPAGGVARTGYAWTMSGELTASGTVASNATSVTLTPPVTILTIGQVTFTLRAIGPIGSGWQSEPASASFTVTSALGIIALTCL